MKANIALPEPFSSYVIRKLEPDERISFIKSYFIADNKTGCRFLTVDAYRDALPFYYKNRFVPLNDDDKDSRTRLLFFDLETSMKTVEDN